MVKSVLIGALVVAAACANLDQTAPQAALVQTLPDDGNSNKIVTAVEFTAPAFTTCANGATLDLHVVGWLQDRPGSEPPNQPGILTFQFAFTFINAAGATHEWRQTGLSWFRVDENGDLIMALDGRVLDGIGRMVINLTTGTVEFRAGTASLAEADACAMLT